MPDESDNPTISKTWSRSDPYVRKAIKFINRGVTVQQLVDWDMRNEQRLFTWDDDEAARLRRLDEARRFINHFKTMIEKFRVRGYVGIPQEDDPKKRVYMPTAKVHDMPGIRELVIDRLVRKMEGAAAELAFWNLPEDDRRNILNTVALKMRGRFGPDEPEPEAPEPAPVPPPRGRRK